jgi:hypothetical protein
LPVGPVAIALVAALAGLAWLVSPGGPGTPARTGATATASDPPASPAPPAPQGGAAVAPAPVSAAQAAAGRSAADLAQRTGAVRDLLDRRAVALRARDRTAFAGTLDPVADPAFRSAQLAMFDNLAQVPLSAWSYTVDPAAEQYVAPVPGTDEVWAPGTALHYALVGADQRPAGKPMGYTYARHGDRWYLRSDTGLAAAGWTTWRGPWEFGPVTVVAAADGLVLGHPADRPLLGTLAADVDQTVPVVDSVWGTDWSQRLVVTVPGSADEMRAEVGDAAQVAGLELDAFAAVAVADSVDRSTGVVTGQRIELSPGTATRMSPQALLVVLRHEATHIAARATTVDGAPMWLLEGFADYVGYRDSGLAPREAAPDLVRAVHAGALPDGPPEDAVFRSTGPGLQLAYQQAWSLARYIAGRWGQQALVDLYRQAASHPDGSAVEPAVRAVLHTEVPDLMSGWRSDLTATFG